MKAVCPKDPYHKQFITTAHVVQEWVVDKNGEFIRVERGGNCLEVVAAPNADNIWTCKVCGAQAEVKD